MRRFPAPGDKSLGRSGWCYGFVNGQFDARALRVTPAPGIWEFEGDAVVYGRDVEPHLFDTGLCQQASDIFLLLNSLYPRRHRDARALLAKSMREGACLYRLPSWDTLGRHDTEMVKILTYNGHFAIWFATSTQSTAFEVLRGLYATRVQADLSQAISDAEARHELLALIRRTPGVLVSFGDDGEPMLVAIRDEALNTRQTQG